MKNNEAEDWAERTTIKPLSRKPERETGTLRGRLANVKASIVERYDFKRDRPLIYFRRMGATFRACYVFRGYQRHAWGRTYEGALKRLCADWERYNYPKDLHALRVQEGRTWIA